MKKKIFKLMCMLLVVFSLTGCTKYINNDKNKKRYNYGKSNWN